jgi:hypothetical protein
MSQHEHDQQGEVSEVSAMDPADADTPIQPSDATAGSPDAESGEPDEGEAGPAAAPEENQRDRQV